MTQIKYLDMFAGVGGFRAYSAIPEHPKPQPLCTETAQIVHRHREHCASKNTHKQTPAETFPPQERREAQA